eukprot:scaffold26547_cov138-Isochrysis_galbana.AAC.2
MRTVHTVVRARGTWTLNEALERLPLAPSRPLTAPCPFTSSSSPSPPTSASSARPATAWPWLARPAPWPRTRWPGWRATPPCAGGRTRACAAGSWRRSPVTARPRRNGPPPGIGWPRCSSPSRTRGGRAHTILPVMEGVLVGGGEDGPRPVPGLSPACPRPVPGLSPACPRPVPGLSPACPRPVPGAGAAGALTPQKSELLLGYAERVCVLAPVEEPMYLRPVGGKGGTGEGLGLELRGERMG